MSGEANEATLYRIEEILSDIRNDNRKFFESVLEVLQNGSLEVWSVHQTLKAITDQTSDAARSLSAIEDHFMPPHHDDPF